MNTVQELLKNKWQPSFVSGGICIGIEVEISEGYSRMLLNTILPDTDKEYKKEKQEIEAIVNHVCELHNQYLNNLK